MLLAPFNLNYIVPLVPRPSLDQIVLRNKNKLYRNFYCRYSSSRRNALSYGTGVPTQMETRTWQRSRYCCLRRANVSSGVSAVLRKRRRRCPLVLGCRVRCANGKPNHVPTPRLHCKRSARQQQRVIQSMGEDSFPLT